METSPSPLTEDAASSPAAPDPTVVLLAEVHALRLGMIFLGAALLFFSVCFSLYVHKQNNMLIAQIDAQTRLLNQNEPIFDNNKQRLTLMLRDLQGFAQAHPDVVPILVNHNLVKVQPQPSAVPGPIAPIQ